jgi:hypothetical protein
MTRETKVGLVVCGSFLCLVGVVLVCKFREGDPGTVAAGAQASVEEVVTGLDGAKPPATPPGPDQSTIVPVNGEEHLKLVSPVQQAVALGTGDQGQSSAGPNSQPPPPPPPASSMPMTQEPPAAAPALPTATPPPAPMPAPPAPPAPPQAAQGQTGSLFPVIPMPPAQEAPTPAPAPASATQEGTPAPAAPPSPTATEKTTTTEPPPAPASPLASPLPPPPIAPPAETQLPPPPPPAPGFAPTTSDVKPMTGDGKPAPVAPLPTDSTPPAPASPSSTPPAPDSPAPRAATSPTITLVPTPAEPPTAPPPSPPPPVAPAVGVSLGGPIAPAVSGPPTQGVAPPLATDAPPPGTQLAQVTPRQGAMPPVGAPATTSTPPITVPGSATIQPRPVNPAAQVESFDEEAYRCKPGDTFEAISQRYYHTDKYARALLMFNRTHPMAGEGLQHNPPLLQVGQSVYIPPLSILEKRYGGHVQDLTPLPPTQQPLAGSPAVGTPLTPSGAGTSVRKYRVGGNGEWMRDIAQRTLGNRDRWTEIYRLNPNNRPDAPVPGNTVLNLPAEARIEPQNMP